MLTITEAAAQTIAELADASPLEVAGLRLTQREDSRALTMGLVEAAAPDDQVIVPKGATAVVFLDPVVLPRLEDAVLDVKSGPGSAAFFLRED